VTKDARRQEKDLEQERRLHMPTDPRKALQAALKQTKKDVDALVKPKDKSPPEIQTEATHNPPPRKRHQPDKLAELDKEERNRRSIRLPKPLHSRLIYGLHFEPQRCKFDESKGRGLDKAPHAAR